MLIILFLSCLTVIVRAVPVAPVAQPQMTPQGGATQGVHLVETINQIPQAQTPAPLAPGLDQARPGIPQQPDPQAVLQPSPSLPQHTWFLQGSNTPLNPQQQNVHTSFPNNLLTLGQMPLMLPPYGFFPMLPSVYGNQMFAPFGYPMTPQVPTPQLPNSPALPVENVAGATVTAGAAPQQTQQQNPPVVYMLPQPMNPALGGLSSEELETAAKINQMGVYSVLTNLPASAGAVQPEIQATGLSKPELQGTTSNMGGLAAGVRSLQGPPCSGSQLNSVPAGMKSPEPQADLVQTQIQSRVLPAH